MLGLAFRSPQLYERLPFVQAFFDVLTNKMDCSSISGLDAAQLTAAGPDEIRCLTPHSYGELEVRVGVQV